jgi:hypothetical protein
MNMIVKEEQRLEKVLSIYEVDIINGGNVLVLTTYAVKENDDMWNYPSPQIFNEDVYRRNKTEYDSKVREFRLACENL